MRHGEPIVFSVVGVFPACGRMDDDVVENTVCGQFYIPRTASIWYYSSPQIFREGTIYSSAADTGHFVCSKMTYEEIEQNIHVHGSDNQGIVCTILSLSLSYPTYRTRIGRDTIFT